MASEKVLNEHPWIQVLGWPPWETKEKGVVSVGWCFGSGSPSGLCRGFGKTRNITQSGWLFLAELFGRHISLKVTVQRGLPPPQGCRDSVPSLGVWDDKPNGTFWFLHWWTLNRPGLTWLTKSLHFVIGVAEPHELAKGESFEEVHVPLRLPLLKLLSMTNWNPLPSLGPSAGSWNWTSFLWVVSSVPLLQSHRVTMTPQGPLLLHSHFHPRWQES